MSSASSTVTYTSVDTDSEPGRAFWPADEELSDRGHMHFSELRAERYILLSMYHLEDEHVFPAEDQPLPPVDSPTALSPGYVADSDPEEDSEEDHADYFTDEGEDDDDDDDDDDDTDDEDEEPFEEEEEEEHLAPTDPSDVPVVDPVPSVEDTEALLRLLTRRYLHPQLPPAYRATARISIRPEAPILLPPEEEVERLLALPTPPPSPLIFSYHHPLTVEHLAPGSTSVAMEDSLFIPPVDRREDIPKAELPPHKRLCLTTPASRYEVGESSTAVPRPTRGHRVDYGFIDSREMPTEDTHDRQTQIYQTVEALVDDRQYHYETTRLLDQEALVSQEAWAHSMGLSSAIHYELQGYRTHTWMHDHCINAQESQIAALTAQVSSLQGHLATALSKIRALQAREQAFSRVSYCCDLNNMPPKRNSTATRTARAAAAAAAPMTAAAIEQLVTDRVSAALANHDTL
ncbi:hypothetical protein Tco_1509162 [Tanacetum coccineum]